MARNITEIVEQSNVQLEIIEPEGGQIQVISPDQNQLEISFSGSEVTSDLEIITQNNTLIVDSTSDSTVVDISSNPNIVQAITTTTKNIVEIVEEQVKYVTGSVFNTVNNTIVEGSNLTNVLFQTQSDVSNAILSNLVYIVLTIICSNLPLCCSYILS